MPKIFEELVLLDADGEIIVPDANRPKKAKAKQKIEQPKKSAKKRGFMAADGKGLDQIREMVSVEGWEIFKDKAKKGAAGKFIFVNADFDAFVIKHEGKIGLLYDAIDKFGIDTFIKNNTIETSTRQDMIDERRIKIARSVLKAQKKAQQEEVDKLNEQKTEITLKIMSTKLKRGSAEHMALREQLHEVVDELKELGAYGNVHVAMSHEDIALAKKRGAALKKERKEKKEKKKRGQTI